MKMSWLRFFLRRREDEERRRELEDYLARETEENIARGMTLEEARRVAHVKLGSTRRIREEIRKMNGIGFLETFWQDLRYAARMLRKSPGFTVVAVLTLALGIGANTTIFTFINELLLRPPSGVADYGRLVSVWNRMPNGGEMQFSYPDYIYFRDHNQVFSNLVAYSSDPEQTSWTQKGQSSLIYVGMVTANYFPTLGVGPIMGRGFLPEEDVNPGDNPVLVLSYKFWQERLGGIPGLLGKTLTLNNRAFTVVGIAPKDFGDIRPGFEIDAWAPISMQKVLSPGGDLLNERDGFWIFVVGRLKPDVTPAQAQANLSVVAQQLGREHPEPERKGWDAAVSSNTGIDPEGLTYVRVFAALLMVLVGMVLLIACANTASLLLARASGRWREMTIRAALGAKRSRILRLVLTESVLLALMAGGTGILLSIWGTSLILALKPPMLSFLNFDLPLDWRVVGFTLAISVFTGVVFGLAPAVHCSKTDVAARLKDEGLGGQRKSRFRNALVLVQVAVCLVLMIGASLCVRSLMNARSIDPGFEAENRLEVDLDMRILGYSDARVRSFYSQLIDRMRALPGVKSASVTNYLPLGFSAMGQGLEIEGRSPEADKGLTVGAMSVGPDYFRTMGIPLLEGREFTEFDKEGAPSVVIVNEELARRYFPGEDAVGKRISTGKDKDKKPIWSEIVGIVKTGKYRSLREPPQTFVYHPFFQGFHPRATVVVETAGDPRPQVAAVQRVVQSLDSAAPITTAQTMGDYMTVPLFGARFTGVLLATFGGLALALAMVGLYGVISYSVVQRTREIGIRVALGANRRDVLRLVVGQGLRLTLIGAAIGLAAAFAVTRLIQNLLYGVSATDLGTFAMATMLLVIVACLACYLPARSASRVDPMVALRYE
ncbi:MAG TPA: ABC transporter permease [Candidatus Acidoferrales bacterium]|nr:ABC transporter permease [Candidatus Acidoferrales bacterium]